MKVITICGSMRFAKDMISLASELEIEKGWCVLQCVYDVNPEKLTLEDIEKLSLLHFKRIDIGDGIFVVNKGRYIGNQTIKEIECAKKNNKEIYYWEEV